jgi:short-subunit dehydrogenase
VEELKGKWAVVTGASSGFGVEFATLLAEQHANLVLVARRTEPMEKLARQLRQKHSVEVVIEGMDLSRAGVAAELKSRLDRRGIVIDVLVNNAGYGVYGSFISQPWQKTTDMLQLNMVTVTELCHVFANDMVKRRAGHILLISSILGYQATPAFAAYAGTKAYVLLFGEALHAELKQYGVAVTVLSPGIASTSFVEVSGQTVNLALRMMMMKPRPVAKIGILAMLNRRSSVVAGILNKIAVFSMRFTPRRLQRLIMQKIVEG